MEIKRKRGDIIQLSKLANGLNEADLGKNDKKLPSSVVNAISVNIFKARLDTHVASGNLRRSIYQVKSMADQIRADMM